MVFTRVFSTFKMVEGAFHRAVKLQKMVGSGLHGAVKLPKRVVSLFSHRIWIHISIDINCVAFMIIAQSIGF